MGEFEGKASFAKETVAQQAGTVVLYVVGRENVAVRRQQLETLRSANDQRNLRPARHFMYLKPSAYL